MFDNMDDALKTIADLSTLQRWQEQHGKSRLEWLQI